VAEHGRFYDPGPGTFGTMGRNALRSDKLKNVDLSLFKLFPIPLTESTKLEFRFETFNLTNTPVWAIPAQTCSVSPCTNDPGFGKISGTRGGHDERQLQFGLKLYF
jgi:hypothetical protein